MAIEGKDYEDLKQAVMRLEFPSFISKITNFIELLLATLAYINNF